MKEYICIAFSLLFEFCFELLMINAKLKGVFMLLKSQRYFPPALEFTLDINKCFVNLCEQILKCLVHS